jgi:hypothetical protein
LKTPINFKDLQARGVLKKTAGGWQLLKTLDDLPEHAVQQVTSIKCRTVKGMQTSWVQFRKQSKKGTV